MDIKNLTSATSELAAVTAPEFKFTGTVQITGASARHAHLFSLSESAIALTETAGKAVTGGMATALMTGSPLAAGAVGVGIAFHTMFGGTKNTPTR